MMSRLRGFLSHTFDKSGELCSEPFFLSFCLAFFPFSEFGVGGRIRLFCVRLGLYHSLLHGEAIEGTCGAECVVEVS